MNNKYSANVHKSGAIKYGVVFVILALLSLYLWGLGLIFYFCLAAVLFFIWYWFTAEGRVKKWEQEERYMNQREIPENSLLNENYPIKGFGVFDYVEIEEGDQLYGMFVKINNRPCFLDLREDKNLDGRKLFSEYIRDNIKKLEGNLKDFISDSSDLKKIGIDNIRIYSIGLYSKNLNEGEVHFITDKSDDGWICGLDQDLKFFNLTYTK